MGKCYRKVNYNYLEVNKRNTPKILEVLGYYDEKIGLITKNDLVVAHNSRKYLWMTKYGYYERNRRSGIDGLVFGELDHYETGEDDYGSLETYFVKETPPTYYSTDYVFVWSKNITEFIKKEDFKNKYYIDKDNEEIEYEQKVKAQEEMGEWISYLDGNHIMPERYYQCSKCGDSGYNIRHRYCPHCGKKMIT